MEILKWPFVTVLLPDDENVESSGSGRPSAGLDHFGTERDAMIQEKRWM